MIKNRLMLFDTRLKKKYTFGPDELNSFSTYTCGPTVYNDAHIGNFRPSIIASLLHRLVAYISENSAPLSLQCITDIDDKIIEKAKVMKISPIDVANLYRTKYVNLSKDLNLVKFKFLRVTKNINNIIAYISLLEERGFVERIAKGIVFKTEKLNNNYWQFASKGNKNENLNFTLWKLNNEEFGYESKYGKGRPGWHTECSAFIYFYGKNNKVNVHIAGCDLKFPHNQNELAQHMAISNNQLLASVWLHVGNLTLGGEKMSKSKGNIVLMKDLIKDWGYEVIKLWMLSANYKNTLSFSNTNLSTYKTMYFKWLAQINQIDLLLIKLGLKDKWVKALDKAKIESEILTFLLSNLNTEQAIIKLDKLFGKLKKGFLSIEKWDASWFGKTKLYSSEIFLKVIGGNQKLNKWAIFVKTLIFLLNLNNFNNNKLQKANITLLKQWLNALSCESYLKADKIRNTLKKNHILC